MLSSVVLPQPLGPTRQTNSPSPTFKLTRSSARFLKEHLDLAKKIVSANKELTDWIQAQTDEAQRLLIAELKEETKTEFAPADVAQAWRRIKFTTEVSKELLAKAGQDGKDAGFYKGGTDTSKLLENH